MTDNNTHPYFVAGDAAGTRRDTATLLVGTAEEQGIDQRDIKVTRGGFRISEALANALDIETTEEGTEPLSGAEAESALRHSEPMSGAEADAALTHDPHPDFGPDGNTRDRIGDEVPEPDAMGEPTGADVAADPQTPVEAEVPQSHVVNAETGIVKSAPANAADPTTLTEGDIDAVKARVDADPDSAAAVLAAEQSKAKPRTTLVAWLTDRAAE